MKQKTDLELVSLVKEKESEALAELYSRYLPMINSVLRRYFIRAFDKMDWHQEAMIICYESCCVFNPDLNVKFGGFFQLRLINHARNLVRYERAKKRAPYSDAVSYSRDMEDDEITIREPKFSDAPVNLKHLDEFVKSLSLVELVAFRWYLGKMSKEDAMAVGRCTEDQLKAAYSRSYKKFRTYVF